MQELVQMFLGRLFKARKAAVVKQREKGRKSLGMWQEEVKRLREVDWPE